MQKRKILSQKGKPRRGEASEGSKQKKTKVNESLKSIERNVGQIEKTTNAT